MIFTVLSQAKTIYLAPFGEPEIHKLFFDPYSERDEVAKLFCSLREALESMGYKVKFTKEGQNLEDLTAIISFNGINKQLLKNISRFPKNQCFLFIFEPPVVMPDLYERNLSHFFGKIFVMFDDLVDSKNYYKFFYPQPGKQMVSDIPEFSQKKFCTFIGANKSSQHPNELYSERQKLISFFFSRHPEDFDLYGNGWQRFPSKTIPHKWEVIKNYKFCFCYENMKNQSGYITEKIFDALIGGAIPVYKGALNIGSYIPENCFINQQNFSSYEELYNFLKQIDESTYACYIKSINEYLASPLFQLYSIEHFIQIIKNHLSEIDK